MADTKTTALTAIDAIATGDLLMVVDDPAGTPVSKKATVDQLKTFFVGGEYVNSTSNPTVNDDTNDGYVAGRTHWLNTATGIEYVLRDHSAGAAKWIRQDNGDHPGYVAGRWYNPLPAGTVAAGIAIVASSVRLAPLIIKQRIAISDLGARITTLASGGNLQLAIYASGTDTLPTGNPLASTGSISTTSTGAVSADITGSDVVLEPGFYWMAVIVDATAGTTVVCQVSSTASIVGSNLVGSTTLATATSAATVSSIILTFAHTFGTWPDLTGQSFSEVNTASWALLFYKVAALP